MRIRGFVKAVAELLGDRVPSYRRHPRRWGAMGLDLSRTEIQSLEQRLVLAAPEIGASTGEYELSVENFIHGNDIRLIDGVLYVGGYLNDLEPSYIALNLNSSSVGELFTNTFSRRGSIESMFKKEGQVYFAGWSIDADTGGDFTYWREDGTVVRIGDFSNSQILAASEIGRMVGKNGAGFLAYVDRGDG